MDVSIDRYLDDGTSSLVTLALRRVHKALSAALDDIVAVLRPVAAGMPKR